jgi:hypothetical protein
MVTDGEPREPARQAVGSSGRGSQAGVARELSELAQEMQADVTTGALLQRIVTAAVTEVPGAQHAGITLLEHGQLSAPAATDDLVVQIDRVQYETGEGRASRPRRSMRRCAPMTCWLTPAGPGSPGVPRTWGCGRCCLSSCSRRRTAWAR